ncbi:MAG: hypothetical protein AVO33_06505 [delta proteobacterium ML8_F1]|nr:MAG: hypothetical protein AVO33_06505 [delta proteobacterium ML8_F1]
MRYLFYAVISLAFLFAILQYVPPKGIQSAPSSFSVGRDRLPLIFAHRGGRGLYPENTLAAFTGARDLGVDGVEFDLHLTKDAVVVVCHDPTIDRTSNGSGTIAEMTYDELKDYNYAYHFRDDEGDNPYLADPQSLPTLDQVLEVVGGMYLIIEIKEDGINGAHVADQVARKIREKGLLDRVLVSSFQDEIVDYIHRNYPDIKTSSGEKAITQYARLTSLQLGYFYQATDAAMSLPTTEYGVDLRKFNIIQGLKKRNMAAIYWTVNEAEEMQMLIDLKVDGIITDYPDVLKAIIKDLE